MAIYVSYSLENLGFGPPIMGSQPTATDLTANRLALYTFDGGLDIFDGNLTQTAGTSIGIGNTPVIDQLTSAGGNIVIVYESAGEIKFAVRSTSDTSVLTSIGLGDADNYNPDVAAIAGGKFWIVSEDEIGAAGGDADIDVSIRNADGTPVHSFTIDTALVRDTGARVAALTGGNVAVAWTRTIGEESEVWYAVYDGATGAVVRAPALFDTDGTINRNVDIVGLPTGGFAIVYEDNGWGTSSTDITLAQFGSTGTALGSRNISNRFLSYEIRSEVRPEATLLPSGLVAVAYEVEGSVRHPSQLVLYDPYKLEWQASIDFGHGSSYETGNITLAAAGNGRIAVFEEMQQAPRGVDWQTLQLTRLMEGDESGNWLTGDDAIDRLFGRGGDDTLDGGGNNDELNGDVGNDRLDGGDGNDTLDGWEGLDTLRGGMGADTMAGGYDADRFDFNSVAEIGNAVNRRDIITDFEQGPDLIDFNDLDANTTVAGVQHFTWLGQAAHTGAGATLRYAHVGGNTLIFGDVNADGTGDFTLQLTGIHNLTAADFTNLSIIAVQGTNGADTLTGGPGGKNMLGGGGNDTLIGGAGADTIFGGAGNDLMTGGAGADWFKWTSHTHTGIALDQRDVVADFRQGIDRIDLSGIDADVNTAGNQAFVWLGTAAHTGAGATLRYIHAGGNTLIYGDVNGDKATDFAIQLNGLFALTASDVVL